MKVQNDGDAGTQIYALVASIGIAVVGGIVTGYLMQLQLPQRITEKVQSKTGKKRAGQL